MDGYDLFEQWLKDAKRADPENFNAMVLGTRLGLGAPGLRTVLLKGVTREHGLMFFTNKNSVKGWSLAHYPEATVLFYWPKLKRQVVLIGQTSHANEEVADQYWSTRPWFSCVVSAVSEQSSVMPSRMAFWFDLSRMVLRHGVGVRPPRPDYWGGYTFKPYYYDFLDMGMFRAHHRRLYENELWKNIYP